MWQAGPRHRLSGARSVWASRLALYCPHFPGKETGFSSWPMAWLMNPDPLAPAWVMGLGDGLVREGPRLLWFSLSFVNEKPHGVVLM